MSVYQTNINAIVSTLYSKGLRHAVISPGSRNAPLIMAFARFGKIKCYPVPDERVAGFVALGMSKQTKSPVAVICTSGTAVLNLYPAIAEAFYMQVPLLVITADRPADMLGRWDGQTIQQFEVFKPHVLGSFTTPDQIHVDLSAGISQTAAQAYNTSLGKVHGPVHLNVPLAEPLYEAARLEFEYPPYTELSDNKSKAEARQDFDNGPVQGKVMLLIGADCPEALTEALLKISRSGHVVVLADVISNAHAAGNIKNWEAVFLNANTEQKQALVPDILISMGKMVLNKTLKQLFRSHPPKQHWHVTESGFSADTFFTRPEVLMASPAMFLEYLQEHIDGADPAYLESFRALSASQEQKSALLWEAPFNEFSALRYILSQLPENLSLHLANSMSVRYVAYLADGLKASWKIHSNRGVSGIDGCSSTAVGMAMLDEGLNVIVTGDIAFFYDINALWQRQLPDNLRIIVLNNSGGGIFRNIDGPAGLPELDPYIETPHKLKAGHMAAHFGVRYFEVSSESKLQSCMHDFLHGKGSAILEIQTDSNINSNIFKQYKSIVL